jgi:hypothetical protein
MKEAFTDNLHIRLIINRGYASTTAVHDAFLRLEGHSQEDQELTILYVGDHDPSGLDMLRDIKDRLKEFGLYNVKLVPVALTQQQIEKYKPKPNPAKVKDPRAADYIAKFGNVSWEVDALKPRILNKLIEDAILERIDEEQVEQETEDKKALEVFAEIETKNIRMLGHALKEMEENLEDDDADLGVVQVQAEAALKFFNVSFRKLMEEDKE